MPTTTEVGGGGGGGVCEDREAINGERREQVRVPGLGETELLAGVGGNGHGGGGSGARAAAAI
jgi:hypothetical protein